jgi:hypothetical protein
MVRTQIQLTEKQIESLRELSAATGRSIADLTREAVTAYLQCRGVKSRAMLIEQAIGAAGQFGSGTADVSAHHDRYLSEAYR